MKQTMAVGTHVRITEDGQPTTVVRLVRFNSKVGQVRERNCVF